MKCNAAGYFFVVLFTFLGLLAEAGVHLLDWWPPGNTYGLFSKLEPEVWDLYDLPVVNTQWLFYIWIVVYMLQIIWVAYGFQLLCRGNFFGNVYSKFAVLPWHCFVIFLFALAGDFGWLYLWNSKIEYFRFAPICLAISCLLAYAVLAAAGMATTKHASMLKKAKSLGLVWENRWVVHNAISAFATWVTIILMYNVVVLIHYYELLPAGYASFIFLGMLMCYLVIYITTDFFLCRDYFLAVLSPYILCAVSFAGSLEKNWPRGEKPVGYYFIVSAILTGCSVVIVIVKMCVICCLRKTKREKREEEDDRVRRFGDFQLELRTLETETDDF